MKTQYTLETLAEYISATATVKSVEDTSRMPALTGTLEAVLIDENHFVELRGDPNYVFKMPIKDFILQMAEDCGVEVMATDFLPQ